MRFGMWQIDDFSYQKDSFVSWYQHCTCTMGESTRTPWRKDSTRSSWPINVHQSQAKKLRVLGKNDVVHGVLKEIVDNDPDADGVVEVNRLKLHMVASLCGIF